MSLINTLTKYLKRFLRPRLQDTDFSTFVPSAPLTRKQLLIEECKKQGVSIYIDDPSEQSAIFRGIASEVEIECRLNAKKTIDLSKRTNNISLLTFIVATITLISSFL